MERTPEQQAVIAHAGGPALVVAGPGSGKTSCITDRIARLLHEGEHGILAVTFTRAAAQEMRERVAALVGAPHLPDERVLSITTLHSWCYHFLLRHGYLRTVSSGETVPRILSEPEHAAVLRKVLQNRKLNPILEPDEETVQAFLADLTRMKGRFEKDAEAEKLFRPETCEPRLFWAIKRTLSAEKRKIQGIDQDDLVRWTLQLLLRHAALREAERARICHLIVDEAQDLSLVQGKLLLLLTPDTRNVLWVGDDDQAIYGWRGSDPTLMFRFRQHYPDARRIDLTVNFRSTEVLVTHSLRLIGHNRERFVKHLRAVRPGGESPVLVRPKTAADEVGRIVDWVKAEVHTGRTLAVLYRNRAMALPLMHALRREGIAFRILGGKPELLHRFMVKDCLAWLRWSQGVATVEEAHRVLARPYPLGVEAYWSAIRPFASTPEGLLRKMEGFGLTLSAEKVRRDLKHIAELPADRAIAYIRQSIGYDRFLQNYCAQTGADLAEAAEVLDLFMALGTGYTVPEFLDLVTKEQPLPSEMESAAAAVTLATFHSSKGLEFDSVWLMAMCERISPSFRALRRYTKTEQEAALEEERRLCYVAMTRARQHLVCSAPKQYGQRRYAPSRFLREAGVLEETENETP